MNLHECHILLLHFDICTMHSHIHPTLLYLLPLYSSSNPTTLSLSSNSSKGRRAATTIRSSNLHPNPTTSTCQTKHKKQHQHRLPKPPPLPLHRRTAFVWAYTPAAATVANLLRNTLSAVAQTLHQKTQTCQQKKKKEEEEEAKRKVASSPPKRDALVAGNLFPVALS